MEISLTVSSELKLVVHIIRVAALYGIRILPYGRLRRTRVRSAGPDDDSHVFAMQLQCQGRALRVVKYVDLTEEQPRRRVGRARLYREIIRDVYRGARTPPPRRAPVRGIGNFDFIALDARAVVIGPMVSRP